MKIGKVLRKARMDAKLTMKTVEAATGILASNQSKIELGENTAPGFETVARLAEFYNLSLDGIYDAAKTGNNNSIVAALASKSIYIPVISWVQAGLWEESLPVRDEDWTVIASPFKCSPNSYALTVNGDSMTAQHGAMDSFQEGSVIIVDPHVEPRNKSYVIARQSGTNETTFKQLIYDGNQRYLKPINSQYPIIQIDQPIDICGVVIGKIQKIKT